MATSYHSEVFIRVWTRKLKKKRLTREVISSVQGEDDISVEVCVVTGGGIRLHKRYARENPSIRERGSSNSEEGMGTEGRASITT